MIKEFEKFLLDEEASEFFITGIAGTGKTTKMKELIEHCKNKKLVSVASAYTHKAVSVLTKKLPKENDRFVICTLHSYLRKRPTINNQATKVDNVEGNAQTALPPRIDVLFIDEFSMIGERDYLSIAELQYDEEANLITKVVYIGDENQLPPVKDVKTITPRGDYIVALTKVYRQVNDSPLIDTLILLNSFINGATITAIPEHNKLIRESNITELYTKCNTSKVLLAYTNEKVEELNSIVQGKQFPTVGDDLYSPTLRKKFSLDMIMADVDSITKVNGTTLTVGSKYKSLETLIGIEGISFYLLTDKKGRETQRAVVFGHNSYKIKQKKLAEDAVALNKRIQHQFNVEDVTKWARTNWKHPISKLRAKAWKQYLTFKDCVICVDFPHALTVHKSQGSTYENVFLDIDNLSVCAEHDYNLYLKLMYVAFSRASDTVYTN